MAKNTLPQWTVMSYYLRSCDRALAMPTAQNIKLLLSFSGRREIRRAGFGSVNLDFRSFTDILSNAHDRLSEVLTAFSD